MSGLLAAALLAIEIHAPGNCPGATDIQQRMGPLLETGKAASVVDVATIKRAADGSLLVSLVDPDGRAIGDRAFSHGGTCRDQAETVAVTLAIWEAQMHPEIALRLDRLSPELAAASAPAPPPSRTRELVVAGMPAARTSLSLGAAVAGDWQAGSWAPGARIELGLGRAGGRWRARLAGLGTGRHTLDVAPGQATFWRASLFLGAEYDVARGSRWAGVLGCGAVGGVVSIDGAGYAVNRASRSVDAGGEVRARGEWRPGRMRPWVGISIAGWLRRQNLDVRGATTSSTLPRVEPMVVMGADFVW